MPIELPAIPKVSQQPTLQPHKDTANIVLFKKIMQHLCVKFLLTPKKINFFYSPYKIGGILTAERRRWHRHQHRILSSSAPLARIVAGVSLSPRVLRCASYEWGYFAVAHRWCA